MGRKEATLRTTMELSEAPSHIEDITTSLKSGTLTVANGTHELSLKPSDTIKVELEFYQKSEREGVGIRLTWDRPASEKENRKSEFRLIKPGAAHADSR